MEKLPNDAALNAVHNMIKLGIRLGKITPNYKLYGHRNVGSTECPGERLYELIQTWPHFDNNTPVKPTPIPYIPTTTTTTPSSTPSSTAQTTIV